MTTENSNTSKTGKAMLEGRGREAAARFMERRGYEILERDWSCESGTADIIAKDGEDGAIVLVHVITRDASHGPSDAADGSFRESERGKWESVAIAYLSQLEDAVDVTVRLDEVAVIVVAPDRALLKHHINAWGVAA